jgi:hypothetical protein
MAEITSTAQVSDPRIAAALERLTSLLLPGERLQAHAVQMRIFALVQPRLIVAATTGRFIAMHRQLFGGYSLRDVRWQDLKDARLDVGMLSAQLTVLSLSSPDLAVAGTVSSAVYGGLCKDQGRTSTGSARRREQMWREKPHPRSRGDARQVRRVQVGDPGGVSIQTTPGAALATGSDPGRPSRARQADAREGTGSRRRVRIAEARIVGSL